MVDMGDPSDEPCPGLFGPFENVVEVGVLIPSDESRDCPNCMGGVDACALLVSSVSRDRHPESLAIISGCGRRRASSRLIVELVEPMLDADRFRLWPLL